MSKKLPTIETVSETETEHRHYKVSHNGIYLGYYIKDNSMSSAVDCNWNFCSRHKSMQNFNTKTRNEMVETLSKQLNNEPVTLKQDFGMTMKLN